MAYYDCLTNIPNRTLFKNRVKEKISLCEQLGSCFGIIFIDLDDFKSVNDTVGHDGGDYLLRQIARSLKQQIRKTDTVARFGGDEFMMMISDIGHHGDLSKIAESIMALFAQPFNISGQEFSITASAGIAIFPVHGQDSQTLIKNADTAMYEAKSKGKNGYAFCTTNMKNQVKKNVTISNDLRYGLEREQFFIHYQPQIDLNTKQIVGFEALLRWRHPAFGMISPEVFIPIAEKNGTINTIGSWALKTACSQTKKWQDMGLTNLRMGVNLSAIQFTNGGIADEVESILKETGLEAKYLELEITESIAIRETGFAIKVLEALKQLGVSIAIDDFGTGYSCMSRLKVLPIDRIKIDMEFIQGIGKCEKDKAITIVMIRLAKSLGLGVLAEGVETASQLAFLTQHMCDDVQGYYYYKPMPADEIEEILKRSSGLI